MKTMLRIVYNVLHFMNQCPELCPQSCLFAHSGRKTWVFLGPLGFGMSGQKVIVIED